MKESGARSPREPIAGLWRTGPAPTHLSDPSPVSEMRGAVERKKILVTRESTSRNRIEYDISSKPKTSRGRIGNMNKWWNTNLWTGVNTAGHRWMAREKTEESSVSHESGKGWYVQANSQG